MLYGIVLIIIFLIGMMFGIYIPFFMNKYYKKEPNEKNIVTKHNDDQLLPKEIMDEWLNGVKK